MTKPYQMTTWRSADEVEAIDTVLSPLEFATDPIEVGKYECGQPVILTSKDGAKFIGHIADVEDERLRVYIELD